MIPFLIKALKMADYAQTFLGMQEHLCSQRAHTVFTKFQLTHAVLSGESFTDVFKPKPLKVKMSSSNEHNHNPTAKANLRLGISKGEMQLNLSHFDCRASPIICPVHNQTTFIFSVRHFHFLLSSFPPLIHISNAFCTVTPHF